MDKKSLLLQRLDAIGQSLKNSEHALALLALGSCGIERDRLDEYSDLDFFVIVKDGYKKRYIDKLDWLNTIIPIGFEFKNTPDGYKVLFIDDVFCEFAVFEAKELQNIPFSKSKLIWKDESFDENMFIPNDNVDSIQKETDVEWLIGEALSNLYIGMGRFRRGEKLSAYKFVQIYAVDRIVDLISLLENEQISFRDSFDNSRRMESRYPSSANEFSMFIQGYDKTPESAKAILGFLDNHFLINDFIKSKILSLL